MRKRSHRTVRVKSAPMLVKRGLVNDELEMRERQFVEAFANGYAEKVHFDELASIYTLLAIAAKHKGDAPTLAACEAMFISMDAIRARFAETEKLTATEDELTVMRAFCDVYREFWMRQPVSLFAGACAAHQRTEFA